MQRKLSDFLTAWETYCDELESPRLFLTWVGISTIAACAQRKIGARWGSERLYPAFYVILVGPPAVRKGTVIAPAARLLDLVPNVVMTPDSVVRERMLQIMEGSTRRDEDAHGKPVDHSSVTAISTELASLFADRRSLMVDLIQFFDCLSKFSYETKNAGRNYIPNVFMNLLGATTPQQIQNLLPTSEIGTGLLSRILFVCARKKYQKTPLGLFMESDEGRELFDCLVHDATVINNLAGRCYYTEGYVEAYIKWYQDMPDNCPFDPVNFQYYWARRATHVRRLAIIMMLSRGNVCSTDDLTLTEQDFHRARETIERTEKYMPLAFDYGGASPEVTVLRRVMEVISIYATTPVSESVIFSRVLNDTTAEGFRRILDSLVKAGFIKRIKHPDSKEEAKIILKEKL